MSRFWHWTFECPMSNIEYPANFTLLNNAYSNKSTVSWTAVIVDKVSVLLSKITPKSVSANKDFSQQTVSPAIGWQVCYQPIRCHTRKSLRNNTNLNKKSQQSGACQHYQHQKKPAKAPTKNPLVLVTPIPDLSTIQNSPNICIIWSVLCERNHSFMPWSR